MFNYWLNGIRARKCAMSVLNSFKSVLEVFQINLNGKFPFIKKNFLFEKCQTKAAERTIMLVIDIVMQIHYATEVATQFQRL